MKNLVPECVDKRMSDSILLQKTGKTLQDWFSFIDRFTSLGLSEMELSRLIHDNFKIGAWFQNAIITSYLTQKQSTVANIPPGGIRIKNSLKLNLPLQTLYNLWSDHKLRNTWFPLVSYTIVRDNPKKLIQLMWFDSVSIVDIRFSKIDKAISLVEIVHYNLPDRKVALEMEAYWKRILLTLNESVTSDLFHSIIMDT